MANLTLEQIEEIAGRKTHSMKWITIGTAERDALCEMARQCVAWREDRMTLLSDELEAMVSEALVCPFSGGCCRPNDACICQCHAVSAIRTLVRRVVESVRQDTIEECISIVADKSEGDMDFALFRLRALAQPKETTP